MRLSTEAIARACARHPWRTIGAWLVVVAAAAVAIALLLGSTLTTEADVTTETEARRADRVVERHFPAREEEQLALVASERLTVGDATFARALERLRRELGAGEPRVGPEGRAALLAFTLGPGEEIGTAVEAVERIDAVPGLDAEVYGGAIIDRDFNRASQDDLKQGEAVGVAAALVVLLVVFGSVGSALLPVALGGVAIVVSLGIALLLGQVLSLSIFVANVIAGMGLALGIDYSLFSLSRFREERAAGRTEPAAIAATGATASRAVLFSGIAVGVALLGVVFVPDTVLRSLGIGATITAATAVAVALTLLPAALGLLGDRVDALRLPLVGRGGAEGRFWGRAARRVMRRPLLWLVVSTALLLAAAAPVLDLRTGRLGVSTLPERLPARQGYDLLAETFGVGAVFPTQVVLTGDASVAEARAALAALPRFGPPTARTSPDGEVTVVSAPLRADPLSETAFEAVRRLRERLPEGALVGGVSAGNLDYVTVTNERRPVVFAFVFGMSFLLLLLAFRSLVVPAKAIALNLLSVGAAYGLLVLVFQKGVGAGLLGLQEVHAVEVWVPVFLFSILFGLSMDYHVFLLSRIRERFVETGDNDHAVAFGIASTGRIITGAALIIVVVFAGFAVGDLVMFQQMGFGVAVALLLDATLIRLLLVPSAMKLLGDRNWYLPRRLAWLPEVQVEGRARRLTRGPGARTLD